MTDNPYILAETITALEREGRRKQARHLLAQLDPRQLQKVATILENYATGETND